MFIEAAQEHYQVLEDIMKLLLPFWPHPPLALLLFEEPTLMWYIDQEAEFNCEAQIMLLKRLIQFLYEVGGPLAPGSEIYCAVKKRLESNAETHPARGECLSLFNQLHYCKSLHVARFMFRHPQSVREDVPIPGSRWAKINGEICLVMEVPDEEMCIQHYKKRYGQLPGLGWYNPKPKNPNPDNWSL
ncbi:hypothetical protein B566_EDAN016718, partial [Ephemera danica]